MTGMTLEEFDTLSGRDFSNRLVLDAIRKSLEQRDELLEACEAILAALEAADWEGMVLWLEQPSPDQVESAEDRLERVIAKATGEG